MQIHEFTPAAEYAGVRLDKYLSEQGEWSRSAVQKLCEGQAVLVDSKAADKNYRIRGGERVVVQSPDLCEMETAPQDIPLEIVYEDADLLVVNKPKGMVVHPAPGNYDGTLVNALLYHCKGNLSGINGVIRPGIVHRIDKDTSGLLIVAKTDAAHIGLSEQIQAHSFERVYHAVVWGGIRQDQGTVSQPIGRHPSDRKKMAVVARNGKNAVTHYQVLARYQGFTYLALRLETGRTHQIRVHMAHLGHPVAGDPVYAPGRPDFGLQGQCLHAKKIGFIHPVSGAYLEFDSPLPDDFQKFLNQLVLL